MTSTAYFDSLTRQVGAANSCADLKNLSSRITATVNGTITAVQAQITEIGNQVNNMAAQLNDIGLHVGTLAATQSAATNMANVGATGAAVSDLTSAIAYCKASGAAIAGMGTAHASTLTQEVTALKADIAAIQEVYNLAVKQVGNLTAEVTSLTTGLARIESTIASTATKFPSCTVP